jgi:heterodisulfide reductase subunit A
VQIVKGKVARITEDADHNPIIRVELVESGKVVEEKYDLVVLSQGVLPAWDTTVPQPAAFDVDGFFLRGNLKMRPALSTAEGLFIAGVATGPKDIPDAIVEAGSAAMEAAIYMKQQSEPVPLGRYVG